MLLLCLKKNWLRFSNSDCINIIKTVIFYYTTHYTIFIYLKNYVWYVTFWSSDTSYLKQLSIYLNHVQNQLRQTLGQPGRLRHPPQTSSLPLYQIWVKYLTNLSFQCSPSYSRSIFYPLPQHSVSLELIQRIDFLTFPENISTVPTLENI